MNTKPLDQISVDPAHHSIIDIPEEGIKQAVNLSQSIVDPDTRWQSYLSLLAFSGFIKWVEDDVPETGLSLTCDTRQARLLLPTYPEQPAAISQILLNQSFCLCLIATMGTLDEDLELPQAIVDDPKQVAHFYVNVQVDTESNVATITGFLRYDQLQRDRQAHNLQPINGSYSIPFDRFERRIDRLLLLAHNLNPTAITLPQTALVPSLIPIKQQLLQPVINTAQWIQRQLNQIANQTADTLDSLLLLPQDFTPQLASSFRGRSPRSIPDETTNENLSEMLQVVAQQGYSIPIDIRASYQELALEGHPIQMTIVSWLIPNVETTEPEWSLLLIAQTLSTPQTTIEIKINDADQTLANTSLTANTYHILQAIGELQEQFTITIAQANTELILPPFQFDE